MLRTELWRLVDGGNASSAISKAMATLTQIGPSGKGTCTDEELAILGHLTEAAFGDRWTRLAVIAAWQTAWENAVFGNGTLVNAMQNMFATGGCSLCDRRLNPPCRTQVCTLATGSGSTTNGIPLILSGAVLTGACNVPSVMPTGELATVTVPSRSILPIDVGGGIFACVTGFRSMGVTNCGGAFPTVDVDFCVDHLVDAGVDDCGETEPGVQRLCLPDVEDVTHPGVTQGGACVTLTTGAPAAGAAYTLTTNRIQVILPGEEGADGLPCTADDAPAAVGAGATNLFTSGTVTTRVIDPNNDDAASDLTAGPTSGSTFDCAKLAQGDMGGGTTVSAFSALHALSGNDQVIETRLVCQ